MTFLHALWKRVGHALLLFCILCTTQAHEKLDEHDLKKKLMERYIRSVRPVESYQDTVQVKFDIAMRALVDLDEKNQVLTTSTWIRVYWRDAYLVWNPFNYSHIESVNFSPSEVWVPDLVLYNSADENGRGLLDTSMKTNVKVRYDGTVAWLCPMVLKSECTVDIEFFPFDKQSCPLHFGLWTFDGLKVNLSIVREGGDLSSYLPSGEFNLDSMTGHRDDAYYTVAPDIPFPYIIYHINITRRTKFYLMNIIWPGILIALLAALCYVLPPECGERIGLGITNLLAMMVFLLMISESIPPTSDAIPLASKFFTSVLVLSGLTLLTSAIVITFTFYSNPSPNGIPWFIRVFINKWVARVVLVKPPTSEDKRQYENYKNSITVENAAYQGNLNSHMISTVERYTKLAENGYPLNRAQTNARLQDTRPLIRNDYGQKISAGVEKIVEKLRADEMEADYKAEWRRAAKVVDRVFLVCFLICIAGSLLSIYIDAPEFYVP